MTRSPLITTRTPSVNRLPLVGGASNISRLLLETSDLLLLENGVDALLLEESGTFNGGRQPIIKTRVPV